MDHRLRLRMLQTVMTLMVEARELAHDSHVAFMAGNESQASALLNQARGVMQACNAMLATVNAAGA